MHRKFAILVMTVFPFILVAADGNEMDWRYGKYGVKVVTNAPSRWELASATNALRESILALVYSPSNPPPQSAAFSTNAAYAVTVTGPQSNDIATVLGWGNHAGLYRLIDWVPSWGDVTGKPSAFAPDIHNQSWETITNPPASIVTALQPGATNALRESILALVYSPSNPPPAPNYVGYATNSQYALTVTGPQSNVIASALQPAATGGVLRVESDPVALAALKEFSITNCITTLWDREGGWYTIASNIVTRYYVERGGAWVSTLTDADADSGLYNGCVTSNIAYPIPQQWVNDAIGVGVFDNSGNGDWVVVPNVPLTDGSSSAAVFQCPVLLGTNSYHSSGASGTWTLEYVVGAGSFKTNSITYRFQSEKDFSDLTNRLFTVEDRATNALLAHVSCTNNPHSVTAAQIGAATESELTNEAALRQAADAHLAAVADTNNTASSNLISRIDTLSSAQNWVQSNLLETRYDLWSLRKTTSLGFLDGLGFWFSDATTASACTNGAFSSGWENRSSTIDYSLLLHFDGSDTDETGLHTVTDNGCLATDSAKFGAGSVHGDGGSLYLSVSYDDSFDFGTSDFTVDFWLYCSQYEHFACFAFDTDYHLGIFVRSDGGLNLYASNDGSSWGFVNGDTSAGQSAASLLNVGAWNHIALTRSGNTFRLFVNGAMAISASSRTSAIVTRAEPLTIGRWGASGDRMYFPADAYIDEFRVVRGTALWTSDFTVPDAAGTVSSFELLSMCLQTIPVVLDYPPNIVFPSVCVFCTNKISNANITMSVSRGGTNWTDVSLSHSASAWDTTNQILYGSATQIDGSESNLVLRVKTDNLSLYRILGVACPASEF